MTLAIALNVTAALVVILMACALAWGYRGRILSTDNPTASFFRLWIVVWGVESITRRAVWDIIASLAEASWIGLPLLDHLREQRVWINTGFSALLIIAFFFGLRSYWHGLPDEDGPYWSWYSAWLHPRGGRRRP